MIRSIIAAAALFLAVPALGARGDDVPFDTSVYDGPDMTGGEQVRGLTGNPGPEHLERVRAGAREPVLEAQGVIREVNFDGPTVVIDGKRYEFAPGAVVTLLDGFGAPTLLRKGMTARFVSEATGSQGSAGHIHYLEEIEADASFAH